MNKYITKQDKVNKLRIELIKGNWIPFQEVFFTFTNEKERTKFILNNDKQFHEILDKAGYHGAGVGVIDIEKMVLIAHEQNYEIDFNEELKKVDNENYFLVDCSCWEISIQKGF